MKYLLIAALLLIAGCVPATPPPHLANTPGAPVIVDGDRVITAAFRVRAPAGWRIILGAASAPPSVTFAAPDNCALIAVSAAPIDPPSPSDRCPPVEMRVERVSVNGGVIMVYAAADAGTTDGLIASIAAP
jgi:hypothetical protein